MLKDKNNKEIDLSKYKDPSGLTIGKLNFGLWLSEKRPQITKLVIFFLIALSAFFFIYSSYSYIVYFLDKSQDDLNVNIEVTSPKNLVSDLVISEPKILKNGDNYDFATLVKNPNDKFSAYFDYCFALEGGENLCDKGFIFPREEKYFSILGKKSTSSLMSVKFNLINFNWKRIDAHTIPNWGAFSAYRLNLSFEDIKLSLANRNSTVNNIDSLSFSVTNLSPYSYYELPLTIAFYSNDDLVAINSYLIKDFLAGDKKNVRLSWLGYLSGITRTEIIPNVDLLNESIYLKYQGFN